MYLFIVSVCVVNSVATSHSSLLLLPVLCCAVLCRTNCRPPEEPAACMRAASWEVGRAWLLDPAQSLFSLAQAARAWWSELVLCPFCSYWFPGGDSVLACWCLVSVAGPVWSSGCRFLWMCGVWPVYLLDVPRCHENEGMGCLALVVWLVEVCLLVVWWSDYLWPIG